MWSEVKGKLGKRLWALLETTWSVGLLPCLRPMMPHRPSPLSYGEKKRVLIIATHPDDEVIGAGAALVSHRDAGDSVSVAIVTDGSASRALGLPPAATGRVRIDEARAASKLAAVPYHLLGLPENAWTMAQAIEGLSPLVLDADVVYGPNPVDFHPEHLRVAKALGSIVQGYQVIRGYEIGVPLYPILLDCYVTDSAALAGKSRLLDAYASQSGQMEKYRRLARYNGVILKASEAEVYWEMSGAAYKRVMTFADVGGTVFRGLRSRSATDPLAYIMGLGARKILRHRSRSGSNSKDSFGKSKTKSTYHHR